MLQEIKIEGVKFRYSANVVKASNASLAETVKALATTCEKVSAVYEKYADKQKTIRKGQKVLMILITISLILQIANAVSQVLLWLRG